MFIFNTSWMWAEPVILNPIAELKSQRSCKVYLNLKKKLEHYYPN